MVFVDLTTNSLIVAFVVYSLTCLVPGTILGVL
jgi:hypothetical protein